VLGLWNKLLNKYGYPKVSISLMLVVMLSLAVWLGLDPVELVRSSLVRSAMNSVLVLAMVPAVACGVGLNFALSIGIVGGLMAGLISMELGLRGVLGFAFSVVLSVPISSLLGYLYGLLLNRVKGDEMTVGTYMGFSFVSLMCIGWLLLPFRRPEMIWAIGGKGLRTTITLSGYYDKVLDRLIPLGGLPVGTILFFGLLALLLKLFMESKWGMALKIAGLSPSFAAASGVDVDRQRILGTMISMVLGGIGILVYAQSYGFFQLYVAPLMMPFAAASAILIGGASARHASISHVISGVLLFQSLLTVSLPVINKMMPEGNLSEVIRIIVSNGVILYALSRSSGGDVR